MFVALFHGNIYQAFRYNPLVFIELPIIFILLVLYKFKKEEPFTITKEDDAWVISGKEVERIFKMTKFSSDEAAYRFAKKLKRMGIDEKLKELGAKEGEQVKILDFYFDFKE